MIEHELIYLASIYSLGNADDKTMKERARKATYVAGCLIKRGYVVFSPLTHNDPIEEMFNFPRDWDFWCQFDSAFLTKCTRLCVLNLPGWKDSVGIAGEIRMAKTHGLIIEYLDWADFKEGYDALYKTIR